MGGASLMIILVQLNNCHSLTLTDLARWVERTPLLQMIRSETFLTGKRSLPDFGGRY